PRRTILLLLGCGAVVAATTRMLVWSESPQGFQRAYNGLDTRADALLLGCMLGVALHGRRPTVGRALDLASLAALAYLGWRVVTGRIRASSFYMGELSMVAVAAAVVVAALVLRPHGWIGRALSMRGLVWLGKISYSLYLWHRLVFVVRDGDRL